MILYIKTAFWQLTPSGKVIHFSFENILWEGVSIGLSKMDLAARFWNLTTEFFNSTLVFPQMVQKG